VSGQLPGGLELSKAEGIVLVGLALDVLEFPGLAGGIGDLAGQAELAAEVVDPAGEGEGFEGDERGLVALDAPPEDTLTDLPQHHNKINHLVMA
jgi:hypothetical protein